MKTYKVGDKVTFLRERLLPNMRVADDLWEVIGVEQVPKGCGGVGHSQWLTLKDYYPRQVSAWFFDDTVPYQAIKQDTYR